MNAGQTALHRVRSGRAAGFTLVELMAVIVILGILMAFLLPRLGVFGEVVRGNATRVFLEGQLAAAIAEFENEYGDFPPSSWKEEWGAKPNDTNLGSETLYLSFWSEELQGLGMDEGRLDNSDGDASKKSLTVLGEKALFELVDEWGNPIAYFHHRDYGRQDLYISYDNETGELVESLVQSLEDRKTKSPYRRRSYQLISPGPDGIFGNEDDITNFDRN